MARLQSSRGARDGGRPVRRARGLVSRGGVRDEVSAVHRKSTHGIQTKTTCIKAPVESLVGARRVGGPGALSPTSGRARTVPAHAAGCPKETADAAPAPPPDDPRRPEGPDRAAVAEAA